MTSDIAKNTNGFIGFGYQVNLHKILDLYLGKLYSFTFMKDKSCPINAYNDRNISQWSNNF